MKNFLVAQSGGPTAAINSTLVGVVQRAMTSSEIDKIYGAINGIKGVFNERLVDIGEKLTDTWMINVLSTTHASALGSCRLKLKDMKEDTSEYETIIRILRKYNIGYFVYIGGNDSMDTVDKLSRYIRMNNIDDIKVMGAPKTIDNDLCEIDHTPASARLQIYCDDLCGDCKRLQGL
jgi:6-phosphofructokinase 1